MIPTSRSTRRSLVAGTIGVAGAASILDVGAHEPLVSTAPLAQTDDGWRTAIESVLQVAGIAGASVFFGVPGEDPTIAAAGVADLETGTPVTEATHFRIGSVTKTFVATVVLQLVDENELSLDDTIDTFGFTVQNAPFITIRHLLNMTSGLPDYTHVPALLDLVVSDPGRAVTPEELVAYAATLPSAVPGEAYAYSNTNYIILGLIVEQLTGLSLAEVLADRLFVPLGMVNTALQTTEALPEPFARGYGRADQIAMFIGMDGEEAEALADLATPMAGADGVIDFTELNAGFAWAAGGCYSTVDDMTRWMPALVNGDLISEDLQRERLDVIPVTEWGMGDSGGYGLGIAAFGTALGHSGTIPGYSTFVLMDRQTGSQQIILTSLSGRGGTDVAAESIARTLRDLLGL